MFRDTATVEYTDLWFFLSRLDCPRTQSQGFCTKILEYQLYNKVGRR